MRISIARGFPFVYRRARLIVRRNSAQEIKGLNDLLPLAETIAARLKARSETIAIAESSTGGLISAALLAVPGASVYFLGGAVAYTRQAKSKFLAIDDAALEQFRPATESHALLLARRAQVHSRPHGG